MKCNNCQTKLDDGIKFCVSCGNPVSPQTSSIEPLSPAIQPETEISDQSTSKGYKKSGDLAPGVEHAPSQKAPEGRPEVGARSFTVTWVLATFFGFLGADRFYLGHVGTGILKLIGFGWFGGWWLVDLMRINRGNQNDNNGNSLSDSDNFIGKARVISAVLIPLVLLVNILVLVAVVAGSLSPSDT